MLTDEALRLAKMPDLDGLEQMARQTSGETDTSLFYEEVFAALDRQVKLPPRTVLSWGERFIAWAWSFPERDGLPFFGTASWARRLMERAEKAGKRDLALSAVEAMLASQVPSERERPWWQKQSQRLAAGPKTRRTPR